MVFGKLLAGPCRQARSRLGRSASTGDGIGKLAGSGNAGAPVAAAIGAAAETENKERRENALGVVRLSSTIDELLL
jgi:hypothetical protein